MYETLALCKTQKYKEQDKFNYEEKQSPLKRLYTIDISDTSLLVRQANTQSKTSMLLCSQHVGKETSKSRLKDGPRFWRA